MSVRRWLSVATTASGPAAFARSRASVVVVLIASAPSRCEPLDEHRHPLAAAHAHRLEPDRRVERLEVVEERAHDPGAGHAVRVAERDRAAVRVQLLSERIDPELAAD